MIIYKTKIEKVELYGVKFYGATLQPCKDIPSTTVLFSLVLVLEQIQ